MIKKEVVAQKTKKLTAILQDYGLSYSDACKIIRSGDARVDGVRQKKDVLVEAGQSVMFFFSEDMQNKKYELIFESENLAIVFKFSGIETDGEMGLSARLGFLAVHRLDRNTEGLVIFAKNEKTQKLLENSIKNRKISKFYVAEVVGRLEIDKTCKAYLLKNSETSTVKIFQNMTAGAVQISTKIKTIKAGDQTSLVEVELLTGRTHQIRAHLAYLKHPIVGDGKYGKNSDNKKFHASKQKLCCHKLVFGKIGLPEVDGKTFERLPEWMKF